MPDLKLDEAGLRAAVLAYDEKRRKSHGGQESPMSERNRETIAPMIGAAITAYLEAARASQTEGWKAIESAPRDGTYIIVALQKQALAGCVVGEAYYRRNGDSDDGWWWANTSPGDFYAEAIIPEPALWQPLPSPPKLTPLPEGSET